DLRRTPTDEEARDHGGEDARDAERLRWEVRGVWREQRDGDLDGRVFDSGAHPHRDPAHDESDQDAAESNEDEARQRSKHRNGGSRGGGADGRAIDRECGPVVEEALALEDADDPARNGETLG